MQLWIIGLLCASALWNNVTNVESSPLGPPSASGFSGSRPGREQTAGFADGLRAWFRGVKNRFTGGGDPEAFPPAVAARMMMELESEDPLERRRNNPQGFFLDLSTLTFDPDRDWGFRLGQWYFIRKTSDEIQPDWKTTDFPDWPTMDEAGSDDVDFSPTTIKFDDPPIITTPYPTSEMPEIPESTTPALRDDTENETLSSPEIVQSAEVLIPSE